MVGTTLWLALLAAAVLIEVLGRRRPNRVSSLGRAAAIMERRITGRVVLIVVWVFIGFHLFARYTVPH
jgi:hypothetical protein